MLEKGIAIAIMLFILSMIAERAITWLKMYYGKEGRRIWILYNSNRKNLRKTASAEEAKSLEVKILGLNIVVSILVALAARADLFAIFAENDPYKSLGWNAITWDWDYWPRTARTVLGCCLTGLFISLGSKFWHDMLDLLLYTKNLRQKMSDPQTYKPANADELQDYLNLTEIELVQLAKMQYQEILPVRFPNIAYINDSVQIDGDKRIDVLGIYLEDENTEGLPDRLTVKLPGGGTYFVTTEIIPDVGDVIPSAGMDGSLANAELFGYAGSACCVLHDNNKEHYLLTCCHVLTDGYLKNPLYHTGQPNIIYENNSVGLWRYGTMMPMGDLALVTINDIAQFTEIHVPEIFAPNIRQITKEDWMVLQVTSRGSISKAKKAYVIEVIKDQVKVKYKESRSITFSTVILLGDRPNKISCRPVSAEGDSGGAVYNDKMQLIGIITAVSKKYTYVVPIAAFLDAFKLKINCA